MVTKFQPSRPWPTKALPQDAAAHIRFLPGATAADDRPHLSRRPCIQPVILGIGANRFGQNTGHAQPPRLLTHQFFVLDV